MGARVEAPSHNAPAGAPHAPVQAPNTPNAPHAPHAPKAPNAPRRRRATLALRCTAVFARAAPVYWCSVYPCLRGEIAGLRRRARAIPDPDLRRTALRALAAKRINLDGAAAFAAFVPAGPLRLAALRAQVLFQALYDYLDVLSEQPHPDPVRRSRALHGALLSALAPAAPVDAPLAGADGGYLADAVQRCRAALAQLPSYPAVAPAAGRLAAHIVVFQSLNVPQRERPWRALAAWARAQTPPASGLAWWETAASAGSSLGIFALIAAAAAPSLPAAEADAIERAYFESIGALHSLLDGLVDLAEDAASGHHRLIERYGSPQRAAAGLRRLAFESRRRAAALPNAERHLAVLAAMAAIYLAERPARQPHLRALRRGVLSAVGGLARPALAVMRLRRLALSLAASAHTDSAIHACVGAIVRYRSIPLAHFTATAPAGHDRCRGE